MANKWRRCRWGDLATLEYGKSLRCYANGSGRYPVYGTNGPIGWHAEPLCKYPGVIIGRKGAYRGIHYSKTPFFVIDTAFYLKPKDSDVDLRWAYYQLLTQDINGLDSGSAIPSTSRDSFYSLPVELPPIDEQKDIASILGTLDDKIELNRKMNETLEAMARAFFKSWFVDFDPVKAKAAGRQPVGLDTATAALFPDSFGDSLLGKIPLSWKVATLDKVAEFALGGDWGRDTPAGEFNQASFCIRGADMPELQNGGVGKMPLRYLKLPSIQKRGLKDGDIVVEVSGGSPTQSTGRAVLVTTQLLHRFEYPLVCSNFCRMLRLAPGKSASFIYLWFRWLYDNDVFLQYENGTTGIKNLAFTTFSRQHLLLVPPAASLSRFDLITSALQRLRQANGRQSDTLAAVRDTLLPKLISGEIAVDAVEPRILETQA